MRIKIVQPPLQSLFNNNKPPMALVEFGGGVSQIVGRVGGNVFQRGRAGSQLRTLPINTGRKANLSSNARASLAGASSLWRTIGAARQAGWVALALTQTRFNRLGVPYTPSAYQVFCELNLNIGLPNLGQQIVTAPAPVTLPTYTGTTVDIEVGSTTYSISGTIAGGSSDWFYIIEATRPQGLGILTNRQPFLQISASSDMTADPADQWSAYVKRAGMAPMADQVIFTRISAVAVASGWRMPSQVIRSVVTA